MTDINPLEQQPFNETIDQLVYDAMGRELRRIELSLARPFGKSTEVQTSDATARLGEVVLVDPTGKGTRGIAVTIQEIDRQDIDEIVVVKHVSDGSSPVIIAPPHGALIDGQKTYALTKPRQSVVLMATAISTLSIIAEVVP